MLRTLIVIGIIIQGALFSQGAERESGTIELHRYAGSGLYLTRFDFTNVVDVAVIPQAANPNALVLRNDGTVTQWSSDWTWMTPGLTNVAAVAANFMQGIALLSNGTIRVWGVDVGGVPVRKNLKRVAGIAGGGLNGFAWRRSGRVVGWGNNEHGQLRIPHQRIRRAQAVACGAAHALALRRDGRVVAWGNNDFGQASVPPGLRDVVGIAAGAYCSFAVRKDGTVVAWGDNRTQQTDVPAGLSNVVQVAAGSVHCLALRADGTVAAWGSSVYLPTPIVPDDTRGVTHIAAGSLESVLITKAPVIHGPWLPSGTFIGESVTWEVFASSSSPLHYQWQRNGADIPGATNATYSVQSVTTNHNGTYGARVENDYASRLSSTQAFAAFYTLVTITSGSQTTPFGRFGSFSGFAWGAQPITLQWMFNGAPIPGANQNSLTVLAHPTNAGPYILVATSPSGSVTSSPAMFTVTPSMWVESVIVLEGDGPNDAAIPVRVSAPLPNAVRVEYVITGGTAAENSDLLIGSGFIVLPAGATNAFIPVRLLSDTIREPDEFFYIYISSQSPSILTSFAQQVILNDDAVPGFRAQAQYVWEGNGTNETRVAYLELTAPATNDVTVDFQTRDGSAIAGRDYEAYGGQVVFPPGVTTQWISIRVYGDMFVDEEKTFDIILTNLLNATTTNSNVLTVHIGNDDTLQIPSGFSASVVATGLFLPTAIVATHDSLLVCEQSGRILEVRDGMTNHLMHLAVDTQDISEAGLLGIALDPEYATNGFFYLYYTPEIRPLRNRVSRFSRFTEGGLTNSEAILTELDALQFASIHNGGGLKFGPDGKLYVGVGDNGVPGNAQTLTNRLGKILRLNRDGTIPEDNPFYATATGANRAIWAYGLRNPWRFDFDPVTSRMLINDVGQSTWEEINDGLPGANFGWPLAEGTNTQNGFVNPLLAYRHSTYECSITGGAFYPLATNAVPAEFRHSYFFADYCGNWIKRLDPITGSVHDFVQGVARPVDLHFAADGSLYCVYRGNDWNAGGVLRITPAQ